MTASEVLQRSEGLYRAGLNAELLEGLDGLDGSSADAETMLRLKILEGMATFDLGRVVSALAQLRDAVEISKPASPALRFAAALALFVRETDFQSPGDALPGLSTLRQLASSIGEATPLAGLHLGVARLEGLRGQCLAARRHLEIARRFSDRSDDDGLKCCVDNVEASLEAISGNLARSRKLAHACFDRAQRGGFARYEVGAIANVAVVELYTGNLMRARQLLGQILGRMGAITNIALGALDSLAAIELREGHLGECRALLARCAAVAGADVVPAPTWNALAHAVTRCSYLERQKCWTEIVEVVSPLDAELDRRQYRALRTVLQCAKARALARLGETALAEAALETAIDACPKGAVDPGIVLQATRGVCLSLRGDWAGGDVHFDRALAACRAIGHQYHGWSIEQDRDALKPVRLGAGRPKRPRRDALNVSLLLGDLASLVAPGSSLDVVGHRVVSMLETLPLRARMSVTREAGADDLDDRVQCSAEPGGAFLIRLRDAESRLSIRFTRIESLEEFSLLRNLGSLLQATANPAADAELAEGDLELWPRRSTAGDDDTVFRSPKMLEILRVAERLAATNLPILLNGETGTGKEVLARVIHERSPVRRGPFVPFNCSAVQRELVESQLFGHRRGAFTGASDHAPGVIRTAEHGTLFLDEIGDLELGIQPKLLRFLEGGEIHAVGDVRPQRVSVRVVTATHADLDTLLADGRFRRDLFYRIGCARITLPPLRDRKDEIPALAALFLARFAKACGRSDLRLGDDFIAALLLYDWPGNIRELANEVHRVTAMAADGHALRASDLSPQIARAWSARPVVPVQLDAPRVGISLDQPLANAIEDLERRFIEHALSSSGGRVAEAAQLLGLSRKGLFLKRRRQGFLES